MMKLYGFAQVVWRNYHLDFTVPAECRLPFILALKPDPPHHSCPKDPLSRRAFGILPLTRDTLLLVHARAFSKRISKMGHTCSADSVTKGHALANFMMTDTGYEV